ncbi:MAG: hypothetical protein ACD_61C00163G0002 [uncultured bacterium]|nr:MAG: hypothetical protein ACD_61C00163G0002 [uncultured bacterium]
MIEDQQAVLTASTISEFLISRGVRAEYVEKYLLDTAHGFTHAEKVFETAKKLLGLIETPAKTEGLIPSLELACVLHDFAGLKLDTLPSDEISSILNKIYPELGEKITQQELNKFLVVGEYGITQEIVNHFQSQIAQLSTAQNEVSVRQFHHLSGAILAYNLLAGNPIFAGKVVDAKLVALAVLSHNEIDLNFAPKQPVGDVLMDADKLAEFDVVRMIDININKVKRSLFDSGIPRRVRIEALIDHRGAEEIELDPSFGKTGKWLDTFQFSMLKLVSNLSDTIYRNPKTVLVLLGEKDGLFDQALTDTFKAIRQHAKSPKEIAAIGRALLDLINEAKNDPQYQLAIPLISRAEFRITCEIDGGV